MSLGPGAFAIRVLVTNASAKASTNPVRAAYAEFVAALAGHPPRPIPIDADAIDVEDRADHLNKVLNALSAYLTAMLEDIARTSPAGLISARSTPSSPTSRPT